MTATRAYRLIGEGFAPLSAAPTPAPTTISSPILTLLQEDFGIGPVATRVKFVSQLNDSIDVVALKLLPDGAIPDPMVIAWQRTADEDLIARVLRYLTWAREFPSQFVRVYDDMFGPGLFRPDYLENVRPMCVFTDSASYHAALQDERIVFNDIQLLWCHSVGNGLIVIDHLDRAQPVIRNCEPVDEPVVTTTTKRDQDESHENDKSPEPMPIERPVFEIKPVETPWNTDPRHRFLEQLSQRAMARTKLHSTSEVSQYSLRRYIGPSGIYYGYHVAMSRRRAELWIPTAAKNVYFSFNRYRKLIQEQSGLSLTWGNHGHAKGYRVTRAFNDGGSAAPASTWSELHDDLIDAMIRLEFALRPYLMTFYDDDLLRDMQIR